MRNLLAFMMTLLLTLGGLGYYLDWFRLRTTPASDGHTTLNIDVNSVKVYTDVSKGLDKAKELADKKAKDAKAEAGQTTVTTPTKSSGWFE